MELINENQPGGGDDVGRLTFCERRCRLQASDVTAQSLALTDMSTPRPALGCDDALVRQRTKRRKRSSTLLKTLKWEGGSGKLDP